MEYWAGHNLDNNFFFFSIIHERVLFGIQNKKPKFLLNDIFWNRKGYFFGSLLNSKNNVLGKTSSEKTTFT